MLIEIITSRKTFDYLLDSNALMSQYYIIMLFFFIRLTNCVNLAIIVLWNVNSTSNKFSLALFGVNNF